LDKISFPARSDFYGHVKARINQYFSENHLSRKGDFRLHLKTAIILSIVVSAYVFVVFHAWSFWTALAGCAVLSQGIALIGFNIMHEGSHGAYSESPKVNWLMGFMLDLVGGSNVMWRTSHNVSHHTFTNIDGHDVDLFSNGLLRLSPRQEWKRHHRFQKFYFFVIYGVLTLWWVTTRDFEYFVLKRGPRQVQRALPAIDAVLLVLTKVFYFSFALVIPIWHHPVSSVLLGFAFTHLLLGLTLTTVFHLAHTTENVEFPEPVPQKNEIQKEWAVHQVETTTNFSPESRFAAWYLGGLNYQVEHHLFASISHVHYPAISKIVREVCEEHGIAYRCYPTFWSALAAHGRFMKSMGTSATASVQPSLVITPLQSGGLDGCEQPGSSPSLRPVSEVDSKGLRAAY